MTVSGSIDFNPNRDEIIKGALRLCSAIATGETPSAEQVEDASDALNLIVKSWAAQGVGAWSLQEVTLFLQPDQISYSIGNTASADNCTASHVETTTTDDEVTSATVIGVSSSAGMAGSDYIGIVLDDGTVHWDTIATVDSSVQVTITTGLASAASSGATVYAYTTKVNRPLQVIEARHRQATSTGTDSDLEIIDRKAYLLLPNKTTSGKPTSVFWDPQLPLGNLRVWPAPDDADTTIRMTFQRTLDDMDAAANTFDFPQEWLLALKYNLAVEIAPEYDVPMAKYDRMDIKAERLFREAMGTTTEIQPVMFYPGWT